MNDLEVNMANHDQIVKIIGQAIKQKKYDIACEILMILNELRTENNLKPYSPSDILFLNYSSLLEGEQKAKEKKCLYIFRLCDNTVKIGVSKNPKQRISTLSKQAGKKIVNAWISDPFENAFEIEHDLHKLFSDHRLEGEYFQIDFNAAIKASKQRLENMRDIAFLGATS